MELKSMVNMQELRKRQQAVAVKYNRAEKAIKNLGLDEGTTGKINEILAESMKAELNKVLNAPAEAPAPAPELEAAVAANPGAAEMV
jgi:hypothetical protein